MDIIANIKTIGFDKITSENVKDLLFEVSKYQGLASNISALERIEIERAERPMKPFLARKHTSKDALAYANAMTEFEKLENGYREVEKNIERIIREGIKLFILEETGADKLLDHRRRKVWEKAYRDRHSEGLCAVHSEVAELMDLYV